MAGGYLGKISAVIAANTGDYVRGLNEGAKATRDFAKTVQSTLNRSATEAARAFEGIYTPLQQFERAIRQAGQLRLNFKGFEGAVRTINDLQKRLNDVLTSSEIDLIVKTSGLKDIEAVKAAIGSISQKEVTLAANAGGLPGLLKARAQLQASGETSTTIINTKATQAELDALIEKLNVLDDRRIELIIDVLNQDGLEKAVAAARRLQDAALNIAKPFAQATQTFSQLAGNVQAAFIPAFGRVQSAVERLGKDLESNAGVSADSFEAVRIAATKAGEAVERLAEAQRLATSGATGRELGFVSPRVADELRRSADVRNQAAALPSNAISGDPQIARDVQQLQNLSNLVVQYEAEVEKQKLLNLDTTQAQKNLDNVLLTSQRVRDTLSQRIALATGASTTAEDDEIAILKYRAQAEAELEAKRAAAAKKALDDEIAILQYRARAEAEIEAKRAEAQRKSEDDEIARLINRERAALQRDQDAFTGRGPFPGGPDFLSPSRDVGRLESELNSVQQVVADLPERLRAGFIPAIREAEAEFQRLNALGPAATAEEIEAARRRLQELADQAGIVSTRLSAAQQILSSFGGRGSAGIEQGLNARAAQGFVAQLQVLQGVLAGISGSAAPALAAAFDQVRTRVSKAAEDGTIRFQATRDEIEKLIQALGAAAARAAGIDVSRLSNDLRRVGDVGRAGLDRWSLAIQQAGFAVDDFFSVTGNLDQRIRAVSNNITQLAFILGSTRGLWIGIGAVIATQAVLALRKWINEGRTAEDQTKALNDALVQQQNIVERLKQAFDSLGDSITRGTLSDAAERAKDAADAIAKIMQSRREFQTGRVLEADGVVQRERANISRATRERDAATTFGARVAAQAQIDASTEIINRRRRGLESLPPPDDREVEDALRRRAPNPFRGAVPDLPAGQTLDALRTRREALNPALERLQEILAEGPSTFDGGLRFNIAAESFTQLQSLAARLDAAISEIVDGPFPALARSALDAGESIRRAQEASQQAISAGIQGAVGFLAQSNEAGAALAQANQQLQDAIAIEDPIERKQALEAAGQAVKSALEQSRALDVQRNAIIDATSALEKFTNALEATSRSAESNLNAAESRRDRAREEFLARPTDRNAAALQRAEADVRRQEELRNSTRLEVRLARERALQDPQNQSDERRIREIDTLLQTAGVLAPGQRDQLIREQESLRADVDRRVRESVENDPALSNARDAGIREEQRQQMAIDGSNLRLSDGQRARLELDNQIASVRESIGRDIAAAGGDGAAIERLLREQQRVEARLREDAMRQAAPGIFSLADAVQNAVLQGPSRAALAPTDVSTVEGSRELTRLLRGDDAARNQDLVQLQREANRLLELIANNGGAGVAN